jgi:hypothetical protein
MNRLLTLSMIFLFAFCCSDNDQLRTVELIALVYTGFNHVDGAKKETNKNLILDMKIGFGVYPLRSFYG